MGMRDKLKQEVMAVKHLCDSLGYGHSMSLATALWRKELNNNGLPEHGAFIGVCDISIKDDMLDSVMKGVRLYDEIVKRYCEEATVPFRSVTYAEDRLEYFRTQCHKAQRRLDRAIKRRGVCAWTDYAVDDAARVLSFYNDVVKMLEDMDADE